jgi:hypothetical protein
MLLRDGMPVAMGIVLASGAAAAFWKTAYDENFAALSPGLQLTLDLSRRQLAEPGVTMTDSCAVPEHPMIDRVWPGRLAVADMLLAAAPGRALGFRFAELRLSAMSRLRRAAKAALRRRAA